MLCVHFINCRFFVIVWCSFRWLFQVASGVVAFLYYNFFLVVMFISLTLLECDERAHWNQLAHWIPSLISIQWDFTEDKIYIFVGWTNLRDTINWMPGTWLLLSLSPIQIVSSCSSWCISRRFTIKNWNGTNKTN